MKTYIGTHFTLEEFEKNNHGFANVPSPVLVGRLKLLVAKTLDPAREEYGDKIEVSSGYRCPELNEDVGGVHSSQHELAEAADLKCKDNAKLFHIIRKQGQFDQLIWEGGDSKQPAWVHASFSAKRMRKEVLIMSIVKGEKVYTHYKA